MKRIGIAAAIAALGAALALGATPQPTHLTEPDYLPPMARQLLRKRMERQGEDMMQLVMAVTLLQRERARAIAEDVAAEPRLTRPIAGGESDLNSALPNQLFLFQDELRIRARELSQLTRTGKDVELARGLGRMTETCVSCHSAYLHPAADDH